MTIKWPTSSISRLENLAIVCTKYSSFHKTFTRKSSVEEHVKISLACSLDVQNFTTEIIREFIFAQATEGSVLNIYSWPV